MLAIFVASLDVAVTTRLAAAVSSSLIVKGIVNAVSSTAATVDEGVVITGLSLTQFIVTGTVLEALPPLPLQVTTISIDWLADMFVGALNVAVPEVALTPLILVALQLLALVEDQVKVALPASLIVAGLILAVTVGAGKTTLILFGL